MGPVATAFWRLALAEWSVLWTAVAFMRRSLRIDAGVQTAGSPHVRLDCPMLWAGLNE